MSIATGMTVCTLNIHHMGLQSKEVPPWIKKLCFKIMAPLLCIKIDLPDLHALDEYDDDYIVSKSIILVVCELLLCHFPSHTSLPISFFYNP